MATNRVSQKCRSVWVLVVLTTCAVKCDSGRRLVPRRIVDYTTGDYDDHNNNVPGVAGRDYPTYTVVPPNDFYCDQRLAGYYADPYFGCQVYHKCDVDGRKDSFLCSNGTLFNQKTFVCDWWYSVDCSRTDLYYGLNAQLYKEPPPHKEHPHPPPVHHHPYHPQPAPVHHHNPQPAPAHHHVAPPPAHHVAPHPQATAPAYMRVTALDHDAYANLLNYLKLKNVAHHHDDSADDSIEHSDEGAFSEAQLHHAPAPVKVYKAQPPSHDGKAQVEAVIHARRR